MTLHSFGYRGRGGAAPLISYSILHLFLYFCSIYSYTRVSLHYSIFLLFFIFKNVYINVILFFIFCMFCKAVMISPIPIFFLFFFLVFLQYTIRYLNQHQYIYICFVYIWDFIITLHKLEAVVCFSIYEALPNPEPILNGLTPFTSVLHITFQKY